MTAANEKHGVCGNIVALGPRDSPRNQAPSRIVILAMEGTTTREATMKGKVTHKIYSVRQDGSRVCQGLCVRTTDAQAFDRAVKFSQDNPSLTVVAARS